MNDTTMGIAGTMALLGLPEDFIGYFLSQPAVKLYTDKLAQSSDIIDGEYDPSLSEKTLAELENLYLGENNRFKEVNEITTPIYGVKQLVSYLEGKDGKTGLTDLSKEELDLIKDANDWFQYTVLQDFKRFKNIADAIRNIQSSINTDTAGIGTSFVSTQFKLDQISNLFTVASTSNYPIVNVLQLFKSDNVIGNAYKVLRQSEAMYSNINQYSSQSYRKIIEDITEGVGIVPSEKNLLDIYNNVKSYLLSSS